MPILDLAYHSGMPRTTKAGRDIKRVLEYLLNRDVLDAEIGLAIGKPPSTYSRRKERDDYPSFEELELIGEHFGVSPRALQIGFGHLEEEPCSQLLDEHEMEQFQSIRGPRYDVPLL